MAPSDAPSPYVLVVSGSARPGGLTRTVMLLADALARQRALPTRFVCARELGLPLMGLQEDGPAAARWREAVRDCSGLLVGSPEYHGSYGAAFKNLVDHLDFEHIEGKPVGLVAVGGGARSGIGTLNAMRLAFRALHAPAIVAQAAVWEGDFDAASRRPRPELARLLGSVVDGLAQEVARCSPVPA